MKQEQKEKVIKIYILADIIEGYLIDLQPHTSHKFKQDINMLVRQSKRLTRFVDNNLDDKSQDDFGVLADKFKDRFNSMFDISDKNTAPDNSLLLEVASDLAHHQLVKDFSDIYTEDELTVGENYREDVQDAFNDLYDHYYTYASKLI